MGDALSERTEQARRYFADVVDDADRLRRLAAANESPNSSAGGQKLCRADTCERCLFSADPYAAPPAGFKSALPPPEATLRHPLWRLWCLPGICRIILYLPWPPWRVVESTIDSTSYDLLDSVRAHAREGAGPASIKRRRWEVEAECAGST
jgi:hypothetical protein